MKLTSTIIIYVAIVLTAYLATRIKKIDKPGALIGVFIAIFIWFSGGLVSLLSLFIFFVLGSIASSWKKDYKSNIGLAQEKQGMRGVANVLGNGGAAGLIAVLSQVLALDVDLAKIMIISSFAGACSDTFSSEFGNIYGRKYFNIISLRIEQRGIDGVISIHGLVFGVIGSLCIAFAFLCFEKDLIYFGIIAIGGFAGNLIDSILGATLQRKDLINNHQVNFLATSSSALLAAFTYFIFSG